MNERGSMLTDDIAYLEPLNRHRNILNINDASPILSPSVYIAPSATLVGNVYAAANVSFAFGSVARAETSPIRIGTNTSIGDNTVL
jgi:carbonic anhydrase/acetyltransferase-like protein (isoleucine patch superfamily)